jgi:hypothetical protein
MSRARIRHGLGDPTLQPGLLVRPVPIRRRPRLATRPAPGRTAAYAGPAGPRRGAPRHVGSDRLIEAGPDALIAGVESPALAMPAGLLRSEEPESASAHRPSAGGAGTALPPAGGPPGRTVGDGLLDRRSDCRRIPGSRRRLEPLAHCAHNPGGWEESWGVSFEELSREAVEAAKQLLNKQLTAED